MAVTDLVDPLLDDELDHALAKLLVAGDALLNLLDELRPLLERPAWQADALCLEYPDVEFFPDPDQKAAIAEAKRVCAGCAVRDDCLEFALAHTDTDGIWGGRDQQELGKVRRERGIVLRRPSEKDLALIDRNAQALELRRSGATLQVVADRFGFNSREAARLALISAEKHENQIGADRRHRPTQQERPS